MVLLHYGYLASSFSLTSFVVTFDAVAETIRLSSEKKREGNREPTCHWNFYGIVNISINRIMFPFIKPLSELALPNKQEKRSLRLKAGAVEVCYGIWVLWGEKK